MKNNIVGVGLLLGVGGMIVYSLLWGETTVEYQNDNATTTVVEMVEEEIVDVVEKANAELERINTELDAEKTHLLKEREAIDARLERIQEIRSSFQ